MKPPRIRGHALTMARTLAEAPGTQAVIREVMKRGLGIDLLPGLPESMRGEVPIGTQPVRSRPLDGKRAPELVAPSERAWPRSVASYRSAYASGRATPRAVAERAIAALAELSARRPSMNVLVASDPDKTLAEAAASTARIA